MKKLTAYLGLLLLFSAGIGIGISGHSTWMKQRFKRFEKRGPRFMQGDNMKRMTERLKLSPEQHAPIEEILTTNRDKAKALRQKHSAEYKELNRESFTAIQEILTDEQRVEFKKILKFQEQKPKGPRGGESQKKQAGRKRGNESLNGTPNRNRRPNRPNQPEREMTPPEQPPEDIPEPIATDQ